MLPRKLDARYAESQALRLRTQLHISGNMPANPYDAATQLGIDVRFVDMPSVEGIYLPEADGQILVSGLRPAGRQSFTCAHELAHHHLGHGEKVDEVIEARRTEKIYEKDEFQADTFASFFLMPRAAVAHAFNARGWDIKNASPEQFYQVSKWLGVGYTTLVGHASRQLKMLDWVRADELMGKNLKSVRLAILGRKSGTAVFVIDRHWAHRTVDCEIGDVLVLPSNSSLSGITVSILEKRAASVLAQASERGVTTISCDGGKWAINVRVARKNYIGRYIYRYLQEEPLED